MANVQNVRNKVGYIHIGEDKLEISYDLNAFAEIEESYGSIDGAMNALESGSLKALRCVLWAGLLAHYPDMTQREVGAMIGLSDINQVSNDLATVLLGSVPSEQQKTEADKDPN